MYMLCPKHILDPVLVQKGGGYSIVVESMVVNAYTIRVEMRHKLQQINAKYKDVVDKHHAKLFKKGDKAMCFYTKRDFQLGPYNKLLKKKYDPYNIIRVF